MPILPFIRDDELKKYTKEVLDKTRIAEADAQAKIYSNVVDPFSAIFDAMPHNLSIDEWMVQERSRQIQKTLQNALGDFHQNILGSVTGWHNAGRGGSFDIENREKMIIAELKNKHNTINSSSAEALYLKLANHLRYSEKKYTAYVVFIIPKLSEQYNTRWSPNKKTMALREDIRRIDGYSFYALASGYDNALKMLYEALPSVIGEIVGVSRDRVTMSRLYLDLFQRAYNK
jgi:hypothetical protein